MCSNQTNTIPKWVKDLSPSKMTNPEPSSNSNSFNYHHSPIRYLQRGKHSLVKDSSIQSDDSNSICSSIEFMLDSRRPDPEQVLLGLGFGPPYNSNTPGRIPQRFLQPSKLLKNIDLKRFLEEQGEPPMNTRQGFSSLPSSPFKIRQRTSSTT